jgi:hypothetical protein
MENIKSVLNFCPHFIRHVQNECDNHGCGLITLEGQAYERHMLGPWHVPIRRKIHWSDIWPMQCCIRECIFTDQLFSLRLVIEKACEFGTDLHLLFTNFKQVHDSIDAEHIQLQGNLESLQYWLIL